MTKAEVISITALQDHAVVEMLPEFRERLAEIQCQSTWDACELDIAIREYMIWHDVVFHTSWCGTWFSN